MAASRRLRVGQKQKIWPDIAIAVGGLVAGFSSSTLVAIAMAPGDVPVDLFTTGTGVAVLLSAIYFAAGVQGKLVNRSRA